MNRVILLILFALLAALPVYADTTATFGDQNSSGVYRMVADTDGVVTFAQDTGIKLPYEATATSDTLTAAETGRTIVVTGTAAAEFELPAAVPGMSFTFISSSTARIVLDPNGTEIINYLTLSAGDRLSSPFTAADSITIFCAVAGKWDVRTIKGTWIDYN